MNQEKPDWADEWVWRGDWVRRVSVDLEARRLDEDETKEPYYLRPWPEGPWDAEPDKVVWREPELPYPLMVVRNNFGALCGYVGIPPEHPLHGVTYQEVESRFEVHGGLTFSSDCDPRGRICHVPREGESDHVWWFGFDCAHFGDDSPGMVYHRNGHYRDLGYVRLEVMSLARQLLDIQQRGLVDGRSG